MIKVPSLLHVDEMGFVSLEQNTALTVNRFSHRVQSKLKQKALCRRIIVRQAIIPLQHSLRSSNV